MKAIEVSPTTTVHISRRALSEIDESIFRANLRVTTPAGDNLFANLIEGFKDSSLLFLRWIRDAYEKAETGNLEQNLRMLRNSALLIGASRLAGLSSDYLYAIREGQPFSSTDIDTLGQASISFCKAADRYRAEPHHN